MKWSLILGKEWEINTTTKKEEDNPVETPTILASFQRLPEEILSSVEHAKEMLGYVVQMENFFDEKNFQNLKQTKIDVTYTILLIKN